MGIHCGVDIIDIDRIAKALETIGQAFKNRVFTEYEVSYCESKGSMKYQSYAARFAAKEAVSKALGTGFSCGVSWRDIEVRCDEGGKPCACLSGQAKSIYDRMQGVDISISLSHADKQSIAFAVIQTK